MTLGDWVEESADAVAEYGPLRGGRIAVLKLWEGALIRFGDRVWNWGTPVYEADWDVLVVLDACRPDLLSEVIGEYDFLPATVDTHDSPASQSAEWMEKTFAPAYEEAVARTAYVTGNPFSRALDGDRFARLDEVWRYAWDDDFGGIPPRPVTERAVVAGRETDVDRLVVHYMQPHVPFRSEAFDAGHTLEEALDGENGDDAYVWYRLRDGDIDLDAVWTAYRDTLRWVLDDVAVLLENVDAPEVVVTADHANAVGEWGVYEHPPTVPVPAVKRVPWVRITATDRGGFDPDIEPPETNATTDEEIERRLTALGYR